MKGMIKLFFEMVITNISKKNQTMMCKQLRSNVEHNVPRTNAIRMILKRLHRREVGETQSKCYIINWTQCFKSEAFFPEWSKICPYLTGAFQSKAVTEGWVSNYYEIFTIFKLTELFPCFTEINQILHSFSLKYIVHNCEIMHLLVRFRARWNNINEPLAKRFCTLRAFGK